MRAVPFHIAVIFALAVLIAQSAPLQRGQKPPTKENPQGYSKDVLEPLKEQPLLKQTPSYAPPRKMDAKTPAGLADVVLKQFGTEFEIFSEFSTPLLTGDLNGDGVQDAVIVARSKNPLTQQALYNYKAVSPQDEYFGFGDPKIMTETEFERWDQRKLLLVIHGSGPEAWRAEQPKEKFLLVNVPFDRLSIIATQHKKKKMDVISAEETSVMSSLVYWTGKKYKWAPNSSAE